MTAPKPKTWQEISQKRIAIRTISWGDAGNAETAEILVPVSLKPVLFAVENQSSGIFDVTLEHNLRNKDIISASIGEAENGTVTVVAVTEDIPEEVQADEYVIEVVVPEIAQGLAVSMAGGVIIISLATKEDEENNKEIILDDSTNTSAAVATAINSELGNDGFTATASVDGSGIFSAGTDEPIPFMPGDPAPVWAQFFDACSEPVGFEVGAKTCYVYGPIEYFPRFLGGRVVFTVKSGGPGPVEGEKTIMQIIEVA